MQNIFENYIQYISSKFALDFFISGKEFINGIGENAKEKIKNVCNELSSELKEKSIDLSKQYSFEEKNYGYGADWVVSLVEFVANNSWVGATAKIGGLVTLGKHIVNFIKKRKNQSIFIGIKTSRIVSIGKISEDVEIRDIELLAEYQLNRGETGFAEKEFLFIWGINKYNASPQEIFNNDGAYPGTIYIVNIDWRGNVKSVNKF